MIIYIQMINFGDSFICEVSVCIDEKHSYAVRQTTITARPLPSCDSSWSDLLLLFDAPTSVLHTKWLKDPLPSRAPPSRRIPSPNATSHLASSPTRFIGRLTPRPPLPHPRPPAHAAPVSLARPPHRQRERRCQARCIAIGGADAVPSGAGLAAAKSCSNAESAREGWRTGASTRGKGCGFVVVDAV